MCRLTYFWTACLILSLAGNIFGADVILNEYNAVDTNLFLGGGTALLDDNGTQAFDTYFGRVMGNGGDWFELVVITDHLDMRGWKLDIYSDGLLDETLNLTSHTIWSDLRSGTIITVSEDVPSDISYNPAAGDWWINVQANNNADGLYIEASNFSVNSSSWQLRVRNSVNAVMFGPAGEGVSPLSGVSDTETFRLEATPSAAVTPASEDYDDGDNISTFGSPNQWGLQDMVALRSIVAQPSTLTVLSPNGSQIIKSGTVYDITWSNTGTIGGVEIEFSIDNGSTWSPVYPPNVGNTGSYPWLVPAVESQQCLVRVKNAANTAIYDTSDSTFSIYECTVDGDVTGDCLVNLDDFAVLASYWLDCGNPFNPSCL